MSPSFDLERNAFAILDVGIRANAEQVSEAHDDRMFDGANEASLNLARSRLTVARDRIEEEITYLPELAPNRARDILQSIGSVSSFDQATAIFSSLPNLSKANVIADLIGRVDDYSALIPAFTKAHEGLDIASARDDLERARSASGIGVITDSAWQQALAYLRERHVAVLSGALAQSSDGPSLLTKVLESIRRTKLSDWYRAVLDETVDRYDRWSQPMLGAIEERLDSAIANVRERPADRSRLRAVIDALNDWDALSQPVQLRDEAKGMDEPRSRMVCGKVRDLAVWLANDHDEHEAALELSRALQVNFPELPGVIHQIAGDIETLGELIQKSQAHKLMGPLAALAAQAEEQLAALGSDIRHGHFAASGEGFAANLYQEFEAARLRADQLPDPALPWFLVRSIAIALNNDADDPRAAGILVDGIIESAPEPARSRLKEDQAAIGSRIGYKNLKEALERDDIDEAHGLVTALLANADPNERGELQKLKAGIARRQAGRVVNWVRWGFIGIVLLIVALSECGKESVTYSPSDYSSSDFSETGDGETPKTDDVVANDTSVTEDDSTEEPPPEYAIGTLTIPQLRYCVFEEQRLSYMEGIVPRVAYSEFNARVDDYNNRCRGKSYSDSDRSRIDQEAATKRSGLETEARSILDRWVPAMPIAIPENTNSPPQAGWAQPESTEDDSDVQSDNSQSELDNIFGNQSGE